MQETNTAQLSDALSVIISAATKAAVDAARAEIQSTFKTDLPPDTGRLLTIDRLAARYGLKTSSLKVKFWTAKKLGIDYPKRIRAGKNYLYDAEAFEAWIEKHADALRNA